MPQSIRWQGNTIVRPGMYTYTNLAALQNVNIGLEASIIVIGEADAGQPQATAANPVYSVLTDPDQMRSVFQSGNLADVARFAFDPVSDGQLELGVSLGGASTVYAIKTNQSTQASATLVDASANDALTIKDNIWGLQGNQTWHKIETSGTGIVLTVGRDSAPNIGSEVSPVFGATDTDEWLQLGISGNFGGGSCTVTFDGTTLAFNSDVPAEDLNVTVTGKTLQAVVQEIEAHDAGSGQVYTASILRSKRTNTLASYLDVVSTPLDIYTADKKLFGVSYDIVEWVNASSVYLEATWVGGYEPTTYARTNLSGGATGYSTATTITEALKTAKKLNCRFIVSAFNGDVGSGGAVALATINNSFATHVNQVNPIPGHNERQGFVCTDSTTKSALYTELESINNEYLAAVNHEIYREDPDGTIAWMGAHCTATAAAAAMAGSPYATPLTHKYLKGYDYRPVAADFDDTDDTDFTNAIEKGLLILEKDPELGIRIAKGISTYKTEDNDGRIMLEVVEARLILSRLLRREVTRSVIGTKGRGTLTAQFYASLVKKVFNAVSNPTDPDVLLIEGTDAQGAVIPPYRNVSVSLVGDALYLKAEVTFTQGVNWAFNELIATLPTAIAA